jgi:hypothetical protein
MEIFPSLNIQVYSDAPQVEVDILVTPLETAFQSIWNQRPLSAEVSMIGNSQSPSADLILCHPLYLYDREHRDDAFAQMIYAAIDYMIPQEVNDEPRNITTACIALVTSEFVESDQIVSGVIAGLQRLSSTFQKLQREGDTRSFDVYFWTKSDNVSEKLKAKLLEAFMTPGPCPSPAQ